MKYLLLGVFLFFQVHHGKALRSYFQFPGQPLSNFPFLLPNIKKNPAVSELLPKENFEASYKFCDPTVLERQLSFILYDAHSFNIENEKSFVEGKINSKTFRKLKKNGIKNVKKLVGDLLTNIYAYLSLCIEKKIQLPSYRKISSLSVAKNLAIKKTKEISMSNNVYSPGRYEVYVKNVGNKKKKHKRTHKHKHPKGLGDEIQEAVKSKIENALPFKTKGLKSITKDFLVPYGSRINLLRFPFGDYSSHFENLINKFKPYNLYNPSKVLEHLFHFKHYKPVLYFTPFKGLSPYKQFKHSPLKNRLKIISMFRDLNSYKPLKHFTHTPHYNVETKFLSYNPFEKNIELKPPESNFHLIPPNQFDYFSDDIPTHFPISNSNQQPLSHSGEIVDKYLDAVNLDDSTPKPFLFEKPSHQYDYQNPSYSYNQFTGPTLRNETEGDNLVKP